KRTKTARLFVITWQIAHMINTISESKMESVWEIDTGLYNTKGKSYPRVIYYGQINFSDKETTLQRPLPLEKGARYAVQIVMSGSPRYIELEFTQ
ncbi:hypothetical protein, partial [Leptospira fletcheri]|uniref:hypothetical protein n=1 Tax=Leptospira fletcheri TaxID=2484981 RepID=UPI001AEF5E35